MVVVVLASEEVELLEGVAWWIQLIIILDMVGMDLLEGIPMRLVIVLLVVLLMQMEDLIKVLTIMLALVALNLHVPLPDTVVA